MAGRAREGPEERGDCCRSTLYIRKHAIGEEEGERVGINRK